MDAMDPADLKSVLQLARLKIIFGFLLLCALIALAGLIAMGKVTEAESFGLMPIVTALATLAGGFSNWAFGHHGELDIARRIESQKMDGEIAEPEVR
jgi:membrane protein YqaA with SNARE-associated domain